MRSAILSAVVVAGVARGAELPPAVADCVNLKNIDFSETIDAPSTVTKSELVKGDGATPDQCAVEGYVWQNVKFRIEFPLAHWNGKMLVTGRGGQGGTFVTDPLVFSGDPYPFLGTSQNPTRVGYAFVMHDSGHYSGPVDSKWGWHNERAMIDYGFRAGHVANLVGKAVLHGFFGREPRRSYYQSCSGGGREAMMMAQRYPWDYDGIIAGAPTWSVSDAFIHAYHVGQEAKKGFGADAAQVLHTRVLAQCDTIDGKRDGILDDPRLCKVDLDQLTCREGQHTGCLTPQQATIARNIYEGPRDHEGQQITFSSAMPGSELEWPEMAWVEPYVEEVFRYLAFDPAPGPGWAVDPSKLSEYIRRMGLMDSLFSANNHDLRKFKQNGGKLLTYFGWNDVAFGTLQTIEYYEAVERLMSGREATQDFFRLFMIPGMSHCGLDKRWTFNYLEALDQWVEHGVAPDALTGSYKSSDGSREITRGIKPYRSRRH